MIRENISCYSEIFVKPAPPGIFVRIGLMRVIRKLLKKGRYTLILNLLLRVHL